MASTKILENDAVGSDDGNWNERPVRKRKCVMPNDENDAMRYIMHKADMKAVERITDLVKREKDSLPPEHDGLKLLLACASVRDCDKENKQ